MRFKNLWVVNSPLTPPPLYLLGLKIYSPMSPLFPVTWSIFSTLRTPVRSGEPSDLSYNYLDWDLLLMKGLLVYSRERLVYELFIKLGVQLFKNPQPLGFYFSF